MYTLQGRKSGKKKPSLYRGGYPKLTKVETEIFFLITKEHLTREQIQLRRQKSKRAINFIINNLKKKGVINGISENLPGGGPTPSSGKKLRLHAQEFNIKIIYKGSRYKSMFNAGKILRIDDNTIRLYENVIEVYSGKSFFGDDVGMITSDSFEYWNRFFVRLEHELKVVILKERKQNIRMVNAHYAEVGNELAVNCNERGEKIHVFTRDDGKLWFVIDNSFNLHEAETVHPETAGKDMRDVVMKVFNEYRDGEALLPKEVTSALLNLTRLQEVQVRNLGIIIDLLIPKKPEDGKNGEKGEKEERGWYIG